MGEPSLLGRHVDEAGKPGGGAGRRNDGKRDGADRDACDLRHRRVRADEPHVEARPAQVHDPSGDGDGGESDGKRAVDPEADLGQPLERPERHCLREGGLRILPGAVEQVEQEVDGDVVEQERGDDLVDPEFHFQPRGQQQPQESRGGRGRAHDDEPHRLRADPIDRHAGRRDAAEDHLAFQAEIPESDPEGETRAEPHQGERCSLDQHGAQALHVEHGRELLDQSARRNAGNAEDRDRNRQPDCERAGQEGRLFQGRELLAYVEGEPAKPTAAGCRRRCRSSFDRQRVKVMHDPPWRGRSPDGRPVG